MVDAKSGHGRSTGPVGAEDGSRAIPGEPGQLPGDAVDVDGARASSIILMISSHRWAGVIVAHLSWRRSQSRCAFRGVAAGPLVAPQGRWWLSGQGLWSYATCCSAVVAPCGMCRSIVTLRSPDAVADEDVRAAALQYVRKVSGIVLRPRPTGRPFQRAVDDVARSTRVVARRARVGTTGLRRSVVNGIGRHRPRRSPVVAGPQSPHEGADLLLDGALPSVPCAAMMSNPSPARARHGVQLRGHPGRHEPGGVLDTLVTQRVELGGEDVGGGSPVRSVARPGAA